MSKKPTQPIPDVMMHITPRVRSNDCAIWSLKTLTGRAYADVLDAVKREDKHKGNEGLFWPQVIKAAKRLGIKLTEKKKVDLHEDTGILGVTFNEDGESHAVVLMQGPIILDSDGTVWQAEDYIAANDVNVGTILVLHEKK
jgi:hypothetical protein